MGRYNSSETRVVPVFDHLMDSDPTGKSWLRRLLLLGSRVRDDILPDDVGELSLGHPRYWGKKERALQPPLRLLEWLVEHVQEEMVAESGDTGQTLTMRQALARRDPETTNEAITRLRAGERGRNWFVLEGNSFPDAFLETENLVLVVEGKRMEDSTTTKTKWMGKRSQLIRHMDAAWEIANGKLVYGLLLVEGDDNDPMTVPERWRKASEAQTKNDLFISSLRHRTEDERQKIRTGVLGVATWQCVCSKFSIEWPPG